MSHSNTKAGFTLIELMLAMTFIAILLISIALLVMQIGTLYDRGITLRQLNISGRAISDDIERTITDSVSVDTSRVADGRLCTGEYSYVWNTAERLKGSSADKNRYATAAHSSKDLRLIRVPDMTKLYCGASLPDIPYSGAVELLPPGDRALAVHRMEVVSDVSDTLTKQQLYRVVFLLGTDDVGAINVTSDSCKLTEDSGLAYCAINQFTLTVRAGSGI